MMIAIILSVAGWVFVVYNYHPNTDVNYKNVQIQFEGEEELADRGLGITGASIDSIDVVLSQERIKTGAITSDDIKAVADVSNASEGESEIILSISGPEGTAVRKSSARSLSIYVETVDTVQTKVMVDYESGTEAGIEPIVNGLSDETATVVGATSEIEKVDRVEAYLGSEEAGASRSFTRTLTAVDRDGKPLTHMVVYPSEVSFEAEKGYTKTVNLRVHVSDASPAGYVRSYKGPKTVTVKGSAKQLADITYVDTQVISLASVYDDTELDIEYSLPEGITLANRSLDQKLKVNVSHSSKVSDN